MRVFPLQFYLADILYFIFYSLSPNLGHFGPKPVGLMLLASLQFMLYTPSAARPSNAQLSRIFPIYNGCAIAPRSYGYHAFLCHFMAYDYVVSAPWPPLLVLLTVAMRTLQFNHQRPSSLPLHCSLLIIRCTPFLPFHLASALGCCRPPASAHRPPVSSIVFACLGLGGVLRDNPFTGSLPVLPQYSTAQYSPLGQSDYLR